MGTGASPASKITLRWCPLISLPCGSRCWRLECLDPSYAATAVGFAQMFTLLFSFTQQVGLGIQGSGNGTSLYRWAFSRHIPNVNFHCPPYSISAFPLSRSRRHIV